MLIPLPLAAVLAAATFTLGFFIGMGRGQRKTRELMGGVVAQGEALLGTGAVVNLRTGEQVVFLGAPRVDDLTEAELDRSLAELKEEARELGFIQDGAGAARGSRRG